MRINCGVSVHKLCQVFVGSLLLVGKARSFHPALNSFSVRFCTHYFYFSNLFFGNFSTPSTTPTITTSFYKNTYYYFNRG